MTDGTATMKRCLGVSGITLVALVNQNLHVHSQMGSGHPRGLGTGLDSNPEESPLYLWKCLGLFFGAPDRGESDHRPSGMIWPWPPFYRTPFGPLLPLRTSTKDARGRDGTPTCDDRALTGEDWQAMPLTGACDVRAAQVKHPAMELKAAGERVVLVLDSSNSKTTTTNL